MSGVCVDCGNIVNIKKFILFECFGDGYVVTNNKKYVITGINLFLNEKHNDCNDIAFFHVASTGLIGETRMRGSGSGHKRLAITLSNPRKLYDFLKYYESRYDSDLHNKLKEVLNGKENKKLEDDLYSKWDIYKADSVLKRDTN